MSVYVITGVSKGIGYEFAKQVSENPDNLLVGLARDNDATEKKLEAEVGNRPNVHILHGDLTDYASLKQAAADAEKIVGDRGVDYLIANAGLSSKFDAFSAIGDLRDKVKETEEVWLQLLQINVIGNTNLFNIFLPLVMRSKLKKVIAISSGHADIDFINTSEMEFSPLYAASKAALNVIVSKFAAQYKNDGVLFMSLSPGAVDVGNYENPTPEETEAMKGFMGKFLAYAPDFKGMAPPDEAVRVIRSTLDKVSIESGYSGAFVSHFGNKQWL